MKIKQSLIKYLSPEVPKAVKLALAKGEGTEELTPDDAVTVLFVLCYDKDSEISVEAKRRFEGLSAPYVLKALEEKLDPLVIKRLVALHADSEAVMIMAALNEGIDDAVLSSIVEKGPEEVVSLMLEDRERLVKNPRLVAALEKNPLTPINALKELKGGTAREVPKAVPAPIPTTGEKEVLKELVDDKDFKKVVEEQNVFKIVQNLSMGQKIKLALTGNKSARELLSKDSNKIIAVSVLKNPRITEDEVIRLTASKNTTEDMLREIGRNKDWVKSYTVKFGMVTNPKTPLSISVKLLDHLYEKDLSKLARSKNIPSVLASTARRKLDSKGKK